VNECIQRLKALCVRIQREMEEARSINEVIARGTGGREVSLGITQLEQGDHWFQAAIQKIESEGGKRE